jgi:hypothetical protein
MAMGVSGIAYAEQRASHPAAEVAQHGPVPAVDGFGRHPSLFDCRIDIVRSWSLTGNAPQHYELSRPAEANWLAQDSCRIAWRMESTEQTQESDFAVLPYSFSAEGYKGKRIRYSVVLSAEGVGGASLVGRVDDANGKVLAFDDMQTRTVVGTVSATRYDVVLDVPESASKILVGVVLMGKGSLLANKVRIEIVGTDVPVTDTLRSVTESTTK